MNYSKLSTVTHRHMDFDKLKPVQIPCPFHVGSICLNYCHQKQCLKLLCQQCIQQHLQSHKKVNQNSVFIKSFKRIRELCVDKLSKLIEELTGKISNLKQPKNPQQILDLANMKFEMIRKLMNQMIQQELARFYEQLKLKVNQSLSTIKHLEQMHENLHRTILGLKEHKRIIVEGTREIPEAVEKILCLNQKQIVQSFARQSYLYSQKLSFVDFQVNIDQGRFKSSINQCLKISRIEQQGQYFTNGDTSRIKIGLNQNLSSSSLATPINKGKKDNNRDIFEDNTEKNDRIKFKIQSEVKILHFFQTNSSFLHLIDLGLPNLKRERIQILGYNVPSFYASVITPQNYIFISGGVNEINNQTIKSQRLSKYSLKSKGSSDAFKRDFAKVLPRSSHTMCYWGDYLYLIGGYGYGEKKEPESQKKIEKVNIKTGEVQVETSSKFGGTNLSVILNNCIFKASEEGIQIYNIKQRKWRQIDPPMNYFFYKACGWSKISEDSILVYGGYGGLEDIGVDITSKWILSDVSVHIQKLNCRLTNAEGFLNSPGIIFNENLYALQNIEDPQEENQYQQQQSYQQQTGAILENQRNLIRFDGQKWQEIHYEY